MDKRTVYPGRAWPVEYGGPETEKPMYLIVSIYRHRQAVDLCAWVVETVGREVTRAGEGDYGAAVRSLSRVDSASCPVAQALVCIDTTHGYKYDYDATTRFCLASVITCDGDWMMWHGDDRWELNGFGKMLDSVQEVATRLTRRAELNGTAVKPAAKAPTLDEQHEQDVKDGREHFQRHGTQPGEGNDPAAENWLCDNCHTSCTPDQTECPACGLKRGVLTVHPPELAKSLEAIALGGKHKRFNDSGLCEHCGADRTGPSAEAHADDCPNRSN